MTDIVDIGEPVILYADFLNVADVLFDPATVTLVVTEPDGVVNATVGPVGPPGYAGLTHAGVGRFSYTISSVGKNGVWSYTWAPATGAIQTGYFLVGKATATDAPCEDWCRPEDVFTCTPASGIAEADKNYAEAAEAAQIASRALYIMSDRKYPGICQMTVRPCRRGIYQQPMVLPPGWNPSWGTCGCGMSGACACGGISELLLSPDYRVLGVASVYVDGALVPASAYRIDDDRWLVRTDGDSWRSSQDLTADPHTQPDTFEVTFYFGAVPPADGRAAAKALAAEVYAACVGLECALPANIRTLVRQGLTVDFVDPTIMDGFLGIKSVDRFLQTERYGAEHGSIIVDPEGVPTWRRVGT